MFFDPRPPCRLNLPYMLLASGRNSANLNHSLGPINPCLVIDLAHVNCMYFANTYTVMDFFCTPFSFEPKLKNVLCEWNFILVNTLIRWSRIISKEKLCEQMIIESLPALASLLLLFAKTFSLQLKHHLWKSFNPF